MWLIWKWAVLGIDLQRLESEMYLYSNLKIHYQCLSTASAVRKKAKPVNGFNDVFAVCH